MQGLAAAALDRLDEAKAKEEDVTMTTAEEGAAATAGAAGAAATPAATSPLHQARRRAAARRVTFVSHLVGATLAALRAMVHAIEARCPMLNVSPSAIRKWRSLLESVRGECSRPECTLVLIVIVLAFYVCRRIK